MAARRRPSAKQLSLFAPASALVHTDARERSVFADSLIVADRFGKRHTHVLRAIDKLVNSGQVDRPNFGLIEYADSSGRTYRKFDMTRDGFVLLVMGFTGPEALAIKVQFIEAFNAMEKYIIGAEIRRIAALPDRESGKSHRKDFTDAVKLLATLAKQQAHPMMARFLFVELTRFVYKALDLFVGQKVPDDFRDRLTAKDLRDCGFVEAAMAAAIMAALESGQDDCDAKAVRTAAKEAAMQAARLLNPVVESMTASGLRKVAA